MATTWRHLTTLLSPHILGAYFSREHRPQIAPSQQNPLSAVDKGKAAHLLCREGRPCRPPEDVGWGQPVTPLCTSRSPTSHHSLKLQSLYAEGKQGLPGPHIQEPSLLSQGQRQEVLDACLGEPPHHCGQLCKDKVGVSTAVEGWAFLGLRAPPTLNQPFFAQWPPNCLFLTLGPAPPKQYSLAT